MNNDVLPTFEAHEARISTVLSDNGREYCGRLDRHPFEQTFAQIKHWMRNAQKREIDDIWRHLGRLIDTIEPQQCANYFKNAGYASLKI